MNFDNGHRQRQNQHNNNKQRGRNRNNRRPGGNGYNNNGGNSINRVYESNGPDVKVRGTAQTIAEKYMQLGRDAQSSGDNVMAESYYQFAEHYFRVLAASQPVGQPVQPYRRSGDDEGEEGGFDAGDEEGGESNAETGDGTMVSEAGGEEGSGEMPQRSSEAEPRNDGARNDGPRNFRGRDRFRPRWQNRRDQASGDEGPRDGEVAPVVADVPVRPAPRIEKEETAEAWEAPSFLRRPTPLAPAEPAPVAAAVEAAEEAPAVVEKKPRQRRTKAVVAPEGPESNSSSSDE